MLYLLLCTLKAAAELKEYHFHSSAKQRRWEMIRVRILLFEVYRRRLCFLALLISLFFVSSSEGAVLFVDAGAGGANDGTSWADAYTDLQTALTTAADGDEIWVAAGIYRPTGDVDRSQSFILRNSIALYGGFSGTEILREQRNWTINETVLSGNIGAPDTNADNSYHVLIGSGTRRTAVLDGFTIGGGNADGAGSDRYGGGMFNDGGSPTINNCIFHGNNAAFLGGGIYNLFPEGSPTITGCTFSENTAEAGGGILNDRGSSPILRTCVFSHNSAVFGGGAIFNSEDCSTLVTNSTFSNNTARDGGSIVNNTGHSARITITNSTFLSNSATAKGGALLNVLSDPAVTNCTFTGNSAAIGGGAMYNDTANPVVMNCTFYENDAFGEGFSMFNNNSDPVVTNSIIWSSGGTIRHIFNQGASSPVFSYSITDQPGAGNTTANPQLGPLADNGGPTNTHALLDGSSALDAGTSTDAPATDQRGISRPQGIAFDIGAYERAIARTASGGGCAWGFSPQTLFLILPLLFFMKR